MAEFSSRAQLIESDADTIDSILVHIAKDTYFKRGLEQFGPLTSEYEDLFEYNAGATITYSYLMSLPTSYSPRTFRDLQEHAYKRSQLLLGANTLGLNDTAMKQLFMNRIIELNPLVADGVNKYLATAGKSPRQAASFLLSVYDVTGMLHHPIHSSQEV